MHVVARQLNGCQRSMCSRHFHVCRGTCKTLDLRLCALWLTRVLKCGRQSLGRVIFKPRLHLCMYSDFPTSLGSPLDIQKKKNLDVLNHTRQSISFVRKCLTSKFFTQELNTPAGFHNDQRFIIGRQRSGFLIRCCTTTLCGPSQGRIEQ